MLIPSFLTLLIMVILVVFVIILFVFLLKFLVFPPAPLAIVPAGEMFAYRIIKVTIRKSATKILMT